MPLNNLSGFRKRRYGRPEYSFYDGPPFATGLPHYGHILAGTIKDVVTRYAHQTGHRVERRFGWDCHGLPVEYEIDKAYGIKSKEDVAKMTFEGKEGIAAYNHACRSIVMRYSKEWEKTVARMGRWIDFANDYKTMHLTFMESVWWVFKQLYDKRLVYRGFKVMPYSTGCTTPLSNFEANQNYQEVSDPSVIVSFPLESDPSTALLAWTTTPWTLPSNLAVTVNPDFVYLKLKDNSTGGTYIIAEPRLSQLYKAPTDYQILGKYKGADMKGWRYIPLFDYFKNHPGVGEGDKRPWRVLVDNYVTADSGTGIVHCAPAFGEDDYRVAFIGEIIKKGGALPNPVDDSGCFTAAVPEWKGMHVKAADKDIMAHVKKMGRLVSQGSIVHSYPFCWRSETPLIYRAVPSWFVSVTELKDQLLANNIKSRWVPENVQTARFHNWLQDARDWAISRNRYWGTPIPIWTDPDFDEIVVVSSVEELMQLSGRTGITDIHREFIDDLVIPSRHPGRPPLRRISEVFDCWFESGAMPYASLHYPFENKERFNEIFPADFIAEGLDQTRGWFYTLLVLSTALFDKPPFKNLIVNGLVLAADGKKMSKRLKNYPEPTLVIDSHGADAIRMYLINSPVVRSEPLKFKEEGVRDVIKDVLLPWFNAYRFFVQNVRSMEIVEGFRFRRDEARAYASSNVMDKWVLSSTQSLIIYVRQEMEGYRLYTVVPRLVHMIEDLTNWYVRLNRTRLKGSGSAAEREDRLTALAVLFEVLFALCRLLGPVTPFFVESMYQVLKHALPGGAEQAEKSVHFLMIPEVKKDFVDKEVEDKFSAMQTVIVLGRAIRDRRTLPLKNMLPSVTVLCEDQARIDGLKTLEAYVREELKVQQVILSSEVGNQVSFSVGVDHKILGPILGKNRKAVEEELAKLTVEDIGKLRETKAIKIMDYVLSLDQLVIQTVVKGGKAAGTDRYEGASENGLVVLLDTEQDDSLKEAGSLREIGSKVQKLRKKAGLSVEDLVEVYIDCKDARVAGNILQNANEIVDALRSPVHLTSVTPLPSHAVVIIEDTVEVMGVVVRVVVARRAATFNLGEIKASLGVDDDTAAALVSYVNLFDFISLTKKCPTDGSVLELTLDGREYRLVSGKHFSLYVWGSGDNSSNGNSNSNHSSALPPASSAEGGKANAAREAKDPKAKSDKSKK